MGSADKNPRDLCSLIPDMPMNTKMVLTRSGITPTHRPDLPVSSGEDIDKSLRAHSPFLASGFFDPVN